MSSEISGTFDISKGDFRGANANIGSSIGTQIVSINNSFQSAAPEQIESPRLQQAHTKLNELPLDVVPPLGSLPQGSRLEAALHRNALFVGREADLKALAGLLKGGETTAIGQVAAATGIGGIGKTQLAIEFVYRYGQYFLGSVFWLNFANPEAMPSERVVIQPDQ